MSTTFTAVSFADLLERAVQEPGLLHDGFRAFHSYSIGNQILAMWQCAERGLPLGPISTFMGWKAKGRHVTKGAKAIVLCMPVTCKRTETQEDGTEKAVSFTRFVYRPHWFVLAQTEGAELETPTLPTWDATRALAALDVTEVPFEHTDGNCWGYATARRVAVNPVSPMPHHTRFHELAHVLLGHTSQAGERLEDGGQLSRSQRELEAECVALLCTAALGLDGQEYSRGYVQHWWGTGNPVPERSAQRIMKVADQILRAGQPAAEDAGEPAIAA